MTNTPEITAFLPLPPLDLELLLAVSEAPLHGYGMMKAVEARSGGTIRVELGSLYRMVHRLEREGLIGAAEVEEADRSPGRDRRFYRMTELGNRVLAAELERLRRILEHAGAAHPARPREA